MRILVWVTTQKRINVFHAAEILTDGNILHRAFVRICAFGFVPGAAILRPGNAPLRASQVNIHIRAIEFLDYLVHIKPFCHGGTESQRL